jgi:DNA sulfur modification protein DndD
MIIKKLIMHNFGVYAGTNEFEFKSDKTVVLIGGLNGRGKTTFLNAVLLVLYGANSFAFKESTYNTYGKYLRSFVNQSDGTLKSYIELEFQTGVANEEKYLVHREWDAEGKRTVETIRVKKDGVENEFLATNWTMFIENFLPSALSNFFFFDGEKIAEIAVDNTKESMKESIRSMLGIAVLDVLNNDVGRIVSKISKQRVKQEEVMELNRLRMMKKQAETALNKIDEQIIDLKQKKNTTAEELVQAKNEYSVKGGDVIIQQQELLKKKSLLNARLEQSEDNLLEVAASALPLGLVSDLLCDIKEQSAKEHNAQINRIAMDKINALYGQYTKSHGAISVDDSFIEFIRSNNSTVEENDVYGLTDHARYQIEELCSSVLDSTKKRTKELLKSQKDFVAERDQIERYLSVDINEKELDRIYKEIKTLEQRIIDLDIKINSLETNRHSKNGEAIRATSEFNKATEAMLKVIEMDDDNDRVLKYAHIALHISEEFSIRLQASKTDSLANTVTSCYKKLANKKNLIDTITMTSDTLDIHYWDSEKNEVAKESLSAGEKQLMVISILWALALCSKKKLPVIIDTPLSRLDSNHRTSLIKTYFPNASEQTIILSTDSEIDEKYYQLMKDDIGDEFTLKYDDETKSTTIMRGYFIGDFV